MELCFGGCLGAKARLTKGWSKIKDRASVLTEARFLIHDQPSTDYASP